MRALEEAVAGAATNGEAGDLIDAFTCRHPPLDSGFLHEIDPQLDGAGLDPASIARSLREHHAELYTGPDATFSFSENNAAFDLSRRRTCSYVLLGHSSDPTRAHAYLQKDVVNHELGHGLHTGLWTSAGPLGERLSTAANEAIADVLAHVFDGDPCHGKVLDAAGEPVDCRRRMDAYETSVSDAVWKEGGGSHLSAQSLRELVWSMRATVPADDLRSALRDAIAAVVVPLNEIDREPLSNARVFSDRILEVRYSFAREYEATNAFFRALCDRVGSAPAGCAEHQARIGDPRTAMRSAWLANAPTAVGAGGVALADGRRVGFGIEGPRLATMVVTPAGGAPVVYRGNPDVERDPASGRITLWFSAPESSPGGAKLGWTSDGELRERDANAPAARRGLRPASGAGRVPPVGGAARSARGSSLELGSAAKRPERQGARRLAP